MKQSLTAKVALVAAAIFLSLSAGSARAQGTMDKMPDDHGAMMMKMMQNRPKAMKKADEAVQNQKAVAAKKGMYGCCLKHSCDFCALKMGSCPCGKMAAMDKPVCNECKGGWEAGDGAIPGKTAADIKTMPRMGMDMKMGMKMGSGDAHSKRIVVDTCPITGEKVVGPGVGMSLVGNYEVHFCCGGCKPAFDKMTKAQQLEKIRAVSKKA